MHEEIRDRVFKRINALEKGYRQNIALLGPEGMGKTDLLQSLFQSLCGQHQFIPIYINAPSIDAISLIEKWLEAMIRGVFLSQAVIPPSHLESLIAAADPVIPRTIEKVRGIRKVMKKEHNASLVRELFACTAVLSEETGKKIVLIIDEFQMLEILPATDPFALLGKDIMTEKDTIYIFSSSDPRKALEIIHEKLSLLFANFELIHMPYLSSQGTAAYFENHLPLWVLPASLTRFIYHLSSGHPGYLRAICKKLQKNHGHRDGITQNDFSDQKQVLDPQCFWELFAEEVYCSSGFFSLLFNRKLDSIRSAKDGPYCIRTLLHLSNGPLKTSDLAERIGAKVSDTKKYLTKLVECGFVEKSGSFFYIPDNFFSFWLREAYMRNQNLVHPGHDNQQLFIANAEQLMSTLEAAAEDSLENSLAALLRNFRNDVLEIQSKKLCCPEFAEIMVRPGSGSKPLVLGKAAKSRWAFQIFEHTVSEDDIQAFNQDVRALGRQQHKKTLIVLSGIDQNARLLAHESSIQLFDLQDFNFMQMIYNVTATILITSQETHEPTLGAMAQGLYSA